MEMYTGLDAMAWGQWSPESWDEIQTDNPYFRGVIAAYGEPALDVGCGAGRLLLHLIADGLEVEGCDRSGEMLAYCRNYAASRGLNPVLYEQAMQQLDLPRRYRTIFIPCGSFMCISSHEEAQEALRRLHAHLEPGGALVFNTYLPRYSYADGLDHEPIASPWCSRGEQTLADGKRRIAISHRVVTFDLVDQVETSEKYFELYEGDECVRQEVHRDETRWYFKYELLLMLEKAGFRNVSFRTDYPDRYALCVSGERA
jgi:SAM-dependent methyltransferase